MKNPKRLKKALKYLDEVEELLRYYMADKYQTRSFVKEEGEKHLTLNKKIDHIKELLNDLSMDQKIQNLRLWNKFKTLVKETDDENNKK